MSTSTSTGQTPADGPGAPSGESATPAGSEESQKFFATHARFTATRPTGAFDNVLTSFRFAPRPYRLRDALLTFGVLYGGFIGLPAAAGIWAAWRIWSDLH